MTGTSGTPLHGSWNPIIPQCCGLSIRPTVRRPHATAWFFASAKAIHLRMPPSSRPSACAAWPRVPRLPTSTGSRAFSPSATGADWIDLGAPQISAPDHPDLRRNDITLLRAYLADLGQRCTVTGTELVTFRQLVDDLDAVRVSGSDLRPRFLQLWMFRNDDEKA